MLNLLFICIFSFLPIFSCANPIAYFDPPQEWLIGDPKHYAPRVDICFIKKANTCFPPSINLATEKTSWMQTDYVQAVKKIHQSEKKNGWLSLGALKTRAGEAELTQIDTPTDFGPARLLQLILVREKTAYVLTAAALKQEIGPLYSTFLEIFKSFTITPNLLDSLTDEKRKIALTQKINSLKQKGSQSSLWKTFQKDFLKDFADMGSYWQILMLKQIHAGIESGEQLYENK